MPPASPLPAAIGPVLEWLDFAGSAVFALLAAALQPRAIGLL